VLLIRESYLILTALSFVIIRVYYAMARLLVEYFYYVLEHVWKFFQPLLIEGSQCDISYLKDCAYFPLFLGVIVSETFGYMHIRRELYLVVMVISFFASV